MKKKDEKKLTFESYRLTPERLIQNVLPSSGVLQYNRRFNWFWDMIEAPASWIVRAYKRYI